eukprot:CAMPEP_0114534414 /NCGR_PEP_ID=MMETSP0109-20121206/27826_1 /TAXON_ID=29199 /ORGANISM="Chlorarachnion reptans, Strain CCCM449" /LENGTH=353 /DNA_ID=CAMNT_0001717823 /DNA_START=30 /DNA_END=1091 /DNA_ORIENTATION=+
MRGRSTRGGFTCFNVLHPGRTIRAFAAGFLTAAALLHLIHGESATENASRIARRPADAIGSSLAALLDAFEDLENENERRHQQTVGMLSALGGEETLSAPVAGALGSRVTSRSRHLPFPETVKYLYINIGTSYDPEPACAQDPSKVRNGLRYDPEIFCLHVEPLMRVHEALRKRGFDNNSTFLVHAAVSNVTGLAPFYEYAGKYGAASSLSKATPKTIAADKNGPFTTGARGVSPTVVITLENLLDSIPKDIRILRLKTDMQGYDFTALQSAGEKLRRVESIYNECVPIGEENTYENIDNRLETWEATMDKLGFRLYRGDSNLVDHDCYWVLKNSPLQPLIHRNNPYVPAKKL